jgi:glycosyltransferase involved in cell wall biosynthesis
MKIGVDITVLYVAGAGVFYYRYNLIKAMLARPASHEFVLLDYFPVEGDWVRQDPVEVERLLGDRTEVRRVRAPKYRKLAHVSLVHRWRLMRLAHLVDRLARPAWQAWIKWEGHRRLGAYMKEVDVFHSSDVFQCALPWAKNVVTIHDLTSILFPDYHTAQVRESQAKKLRFAQTRADAIITVSESAKQDTVKYLGIDPSRVHVVHNGVAPSFRPLPDTVVKESLSAVALEPQSYMLHVGTIEPRKNLVRLLQAYGQAKRRQGLSMSKMPKLVQVGMKGWKYDEVFDQVSGLGLDEDVVFLGRVDSGLLPALYNGARLFVYPSLYEGFGLPVLEAMACGTPVVTSNTSSLPEVTGDAAILTDPYDVSQLAEAIEQLLVDRDLASLLQQRGLERAQQFTWESTAQKTLEVYGKLCR